MQKTRQQILEILNHVGQATVQDIVAELHKRRDDQITAVTVRHHLNLLLKQGLVETPEIRHRSKPGRPQYVYALTRKAHQYFPKNYRDLTIALIRELENQLPQPSINVIFEGLADGMAVSVDTTNLSLENRFDVVVEYLCEHGYDAYWEENPDQYILHTSNCPYHDLAQSNDILCNMDMRLVSKLIGMTPRRISRVSDGAESCAYMFPKDDAVNESFG